MGQILAGDIGGTKTVIGLFSEEQGARRPLTELRYESDEYPTLEAIVRSFVNSTGAQPTLATFGIAGPVDGGRVAVTNLPWQVDAGRLQRFVNGGSIDLINDLEALASAIPVLENHDLVEIKPGEAREKAPIAVIAPGTGLGEAFLFWDGRRYRPIPSEGGHTDFGPSTDLELELLAYLKPRLGHVSYERVCSGIGIPGPRTGHCP